MNDLVSPVWPSWFTDVLKQKYAGARVLVVGADGFLGTNIVLALSSVGAEITITSRRSLSRTDHYAKHVICGDLSDLSIAKAAVDKQEYIFDLVGQTGAVESNAASYDNFRIECQPHLNLFKACADLNPAAAIVFCSSRLVYGKPLYLPVDEQHPLSPDSLYAVHKITLENYLQVFAKTSGLRSSVIRLSNPYGPNVESKNQSYGLINIFLQKVLNGEAITLYGDGAQLRDYIHTRDLSAAFLAVASSPKCYGEILNLGGDTSISIRDVADTINRAANGKPLVFIDWPTEHRIVESGNYETSLEKIRSFVKLPKQLPLSESVTQLVKDMFATKGSNEQKINICQNEVNEC